MLRDKDTVYETNGVEQRDGDDMKRDLDSTADNAHGVNMRDIAKAAGVSVSTVSRALRQSKGVSNQLQREIADIAVRMGYDGPSKALANLSTKIYVLFPMDHSAHDTGGFYQEIITAIEKEFDHHGFPVELLFLERNADTVERIRMLSKLHEKVGFVLIGIDDPATLEIASDLPPILLVNASDPQMCVDSITPANKQGGYLATRHLIGLGHRRILHLTSLRRSTIRDRMEGYHAALTDFDCGYDPTLVIDLENMHAEDGADAVTRLLDAKALEFTAVFCANDLLAAGAVSALLRAGKSVPGDCSVIGFDNTRITARYKPGLTTIAVDLAELGKRGALRLLERMENPKMASLTMLIGCQLITRESTCAIRAASENEK